VIGASGVSRCCGFLVGALDVSYLEGTCDDAYVIDIFSRHIVGAIVHAAEDGLLAK